MGESQFLSAQTCHKGEEGTLSHEGANIVTEEGNSDNCTKDCSSGTSASKIQGSHFSVLTKFQDFIQNSRYNFLSFLMWPPDTIG